MKKITEPREFWLYYSKEGYDVVFNENPGVSTATHVIEYSALEAERERAKKLVEVLNKLDNAMRDHAFAGNIMFPTNLFDEFNRIKGEALAEYRKGEGE